MNLVTLEKLLFDSVAGIKLCSEEKLINSALVLLYCGIDTASSLDLTYDKQSVHLRYTKWCDTYIFKRTPFDFTSIELYAARCGVIHETSVESTLSAQGKARRIIYAWGDSKVDTLREMSKLAQMKGYVAVQFEDLVGAYENGLNGFVEAYAATKREPTSQLKKPRNVYVPLQRRK